ncbi:hypothetical protein ILUMI_04293 [Ignelater luminosus]|uniref:Replication protein A subunit n=1 Tax=Ignelater luminosus TaxID=2038154 RepID=A0A8K0DE54_IGNLU|nr:hypothetical protein ILUMI_04293 [Ignelater luminosus]
MADKFRLTEGALRLIMKGDQIEDPIMQVLGSKRIASTSADKERFRLLLSDGKYLVSFAMLTTQINDKIVNGELVDNTIIKVKRFITSVINSGGKSNKRVLVILEMETLLPGDQTEKIGNPEHLPETDIDTELDDSTTSNNAKTNGQVNSSSKPAPASTNRIMSKKSANVDLNASLQDHVILPISSLNPYHNTWVIKARVSNKSGIRKWSNSRGEGQLFSMDLVDESGEIRCTGFRDVVDKFYDMIEVDKVYYISKCVIKVANKQFNSVKNDYEMTLINDTIIQECHDADIAIPQTKYDFINIDKIANIETGTIVDVIGICKSVSEVLTFTARSSGRELKKRELILVDQSNSGISATLWGNDAEKFEGSSQPVVAIKGAKIGEFGGGKNLNILGSSILKINPDIPESHRLRGWFDNGGMQQNVTNISAKSSGGGLQTPWLSLKEAQNQPSESVEKGVYFQTKATVLMFRSENCLYKACPTEDCKKKVVDMENGMYNCEKCGRQYPNFKYRLLGSMNIGDWSGNQWVSMFASEAEKVLGMTSEQVGEAAEANPQALTGITDKANFKQFILKCRAKTDTFNDEVRLKTVVIKVDNINYKEYNAHLISRINELQGMNN